MCIGIRVKCPLFLSDFLNDIWSFSAYFRNTLKNIILGKSSQWEPSRSTQTETDMRKLIVALRNFVDAPKNWRKTCVGHKSLSRFLSQFLVPKRRVWVNNSEVSRSEPTRTAAGIPPTQRSILNVIRTKIIRIFFTFFFYIYLCTRVPHKLRYLF